MAVETFQFAKNDDDDEKTQRNTDVFLLNNESNYYSFIWIVRHRGK